MTQNQLIEYIEQTNIDCLDIIKKKNSDYADPESDAFKNFRAVGIINLDVQQGILVRLMDKLARIANLIDKNKNPQVAEEKIEDTILDAINYLHILHAYRNSV